MGMVPASSDYAMTLMLFCMVSIFQPISGNHFHCALD